MSNLTARKCREIIKIHDDGDCEECFEGSCTDEAKGFLECHKLVEEILVRSIEKFKSEVNEYEKLQYKLLVEGQSLETASENWNKYTEAFSFDLQPLFDALSNWRKANEE